jgi:hypothetical protein
MKTIFLAAVMCIGLAFTAEAQEIRKNALGLRLGSNSGFGGEISYQRGLHANRRLEFDLGWRDSEHYDAIKIVGLYQWVWNIDGGFNWYAGVGGGLGKWDYDGPHHDDFDDSGTFLLAAGDIGIEYVFADAPIQLSLDFRPELYFGDDRDDFDDDYDSFGPDIGLGIRFTF